MNECVCFYFANLEPLIQCLGSFFPAHFQIKSGIVCVCVCVCFRTSAVDFVVSVRALIISRVAAQRSDTFVCGGRAFLKGLEILHVHV